LSVSFRLLLLQRMMMMLLLRWVVSVCG